MAAIKAKAMAAGTTLRPAPEVVVVLGVADATAEGVVVAAVVPVKGPIEVLPTEELEATAVVETLEGTTTGVVAGTTTEVTEAVNVLV